MGFDPMCVMLEEHATFVLGLKELSPEFIEICAELLDSPVSWSSCLRGLWDQLGLKSFNIEDGGLMLVKNISAD
jgi:hypothetical protein